MASGQLYPPLSGTINPMHMGHDAKYDPAVGIEASDCYTPSTTSYPYNDSYVTPYPSSTLESQPWTQYARASAPELHVSTSYGSLSVQSQHSSSMMKDPGRPRSSPSTFGPSPESINWTTTSGLGLQYTTAGGQPTPPPAVSTTTFPPNVFQTYPTDDHYSTSSPPRLRQPQPRKAFTSIAPSPAAGADAGKRKRDDDLDLQSGGGGGKRRKRATSVASQADLSEDDRFLVQLKEDENIAWKDIAARFMNEKGKNFQVAALQMRYKRLREKFRIWEDQDVQALKLAHEYWEKYKWEIISAKMLDFGVQERWPARHCARKWTELEPSSTTPTAQPATTTSATTATTATSASATSATTTLGLTPASVSSFSSPVEGQSHYAFMSMS